MNDLQATPRIPLRVALLACSLSAALAVPGAVEAGTYTVSSCDSDLYFGHSTAAWAPFGNAGTAYASCPTNGSANAGLSNRLTGVTYPGFSHSGHAFKAPEGTTIKQLRWAGRVARGNCRWGTYFRAMPSQAAVAGLPNGQFCDTTGLDTRGLPMLFPVPHGTTELDQLVLCGWTECAPGAAMHSQTLEVTIDDPVPPSISLSGPLASGQWVSGTAGRTPDLTTDAADTSGIQRVEVRLGARTETQSYPCTWSQPGPCPKRALATSVPTIADLPDGRHTLTASVFDAAGNSAGASSSVYVDNTPPDPVVPQVAGGATWRRRNGFSVSWTNAANAASPITKAHWKLCASDGRCSWRGVRLSTGVNELPDFVAPEPGSYQLHIWLEDAAGNQREATAAVSASIRFDPERPELGFLPISPDDPLRVAVKALDRHSGIAGGEIEIRAKSGLTWHGLRTEQQGSELVAYVDDERFRDGAYELRARAWDQAGNEATTGARTDGSAATMRLPARVETRLRVGVRRGRKRSLARSVAARFRSRVRLSGRLTNPDGQSIDGATIEAVQIEPDGTALPVGLATTTRTGRFRYVVRATRSRQLVFRYAGSRRIGSAKALFQMRVPAGSSMELNRRRVRNGETVLFSGRVFTPPIPAAGKLIEMQAYFRGRWRTISTVRSARSGSWRFPYRFGATLGRVTYRFRAQLPMEGGYPFSSGHSRVAAVLVIGP